MMTMKWYRQLFGIEMQRRLAPFALAASLLGASFAHAEEPLAATAPPDATAELADSASIFEWWRKLGNPAPLLLSEEELRESTDCFPIEYHDMQEGRRVLFGPDVIRDLVIDRKYYRAQVEMELLAKLLRLRQMATDVLFDKPALLRLMIDSAPNFLVLARHVLLLSAIPSGWRKREIVRHLPDLGADATPFDILLDLRDQTKLARDVEPETLFAGYLRQIEALVHHVDRLEK